MAHRRGDAPSDAPADARYRVTADCCLPFGQVSHPWRLPPSEYPGRVESVDPGRRSIGTRNRCIHAAPDLTPSGSELRTRITDGDLGQGDSR
jgi:hypothetical protein